ncbi:MAG: GDP-mannose mannosyl hydrolase [Opitutales bacterium]
MKLPEEDFRKIVALTPLVSIDLLVRQRGRYLVGLRQNRPAQGCLFVPGGRIFKDEPLAEAFARIAESELGLSKTLADAHFRAVNEHLYPDSMFDPATSTHYVNLSYELSLADGEMVQFDDQHAGSEWLTPQEIRMHPKVHPYTAWHFPE